MNKKRLLTQSALIFIGFMFCFPFTLLSQEKNRQDTLEKKIVSSNPPQQNATTKPSAAAMAKQKIKYKYPRPGIAALWSIIPGGGQLYNQSYWKAPIVWGIMGWLVYNFIDAYEWFGKASFANNAYQKIVFNTLDSADYFNIDPKLKPLSRQRIISYRDYLKSQLNEYGFWIVLSWGLNVIEAAVDAHLHNFDVSDNLSLSIHPDVNIIQYQPACQLSLELDIHSKNKNKKMPVIHLF